MGHSLGLLGVTLALVAIVFGLASVRREIKQLREHPPVIKWECQK